MDEGGESKRQDAARGAGAAESDGQDGAGSETERFRAITDLHLRHNEAVTGESGVPRGQRDHEHRRQLNSLAEFS